VLLELVTAYLEGKPASGGRCFEARFTGCLLCAECLAQIRATIEPTRSCAPGNPTLPVQDEVIAMFRRWRAVRDGQLAGTLTGLPAAAQGR
jgi:hypothetical protein